MKYKISIICSYILILGISVLCILNSLNLPNKLKKDELYEYNISKNINYKVYLKENDFIQLDYLEPNKLYISDLVDYIKADFNYEYSANNKCDLKYSYDIIATLYIDYQSTTSMTNSNIWSKQYDIIKDKSLSIRESDKIKIQETIELDYNKYAMEIENFKSRFAFPIKSYINLELKLRTEALLENKVSEVTNISLNMDIGNPIFSITLNNIGEQNEIVLKNGEQIGKINIVQLVIGIILFIIIVISSFIMLRKYSKKQKNTFYEIALASIIRSYSDIIVEVLKPLNISNIQIIDVKNFNQLIDLENELRIPIVSYNDSENKQAIFTIIYENICYRFILK